MTDEPTPVDPSKEPLGAEVQQERWSVTLDGIPESTADVLYDELRKAGIQCHVQTVSPRVEELGHTYLNVSGLYEVCVRREDLARAVEVAKGLFPETYPGEKLEEGRLWGPSKVGEEAAVLCMIPWHESWDLAAELNRAGVHAMVLPADLSDPAPPEEESLVRAVGSEMKEELERLMEHEPAETPIEDRTYEVVVERPNLDRATQIAQKLLGDKFRLDGSAYDA